MCSVHFRQENHGPGDFIDSQMGFRSWQNCTGSIADSVSFWITASTECLHWREAARTLVHKATTVMGELRHKKELWPVIHSIFQVAAFPFPL